MPDHPPILFGGHPTWEHRRQCGVTVWCDRCGLEWDYGDEPLLACTCYVILCDREAAAIKEQRQKNRGRYAGLRRSKE